MTRWGFLPCACHGGGACRLRLVPIVLALIACGPGPIAWTRPAGGPAADAYMARVMEGLLLEFMWHVAEAGCP